MPPPTLESQLLSLLERIRALYASREVAPLLAELAGALCQLADAERAFVFLPDADSGNLALAHGQDRQGAPVEVVEPKVVQLARSVHHDRREVVATNQAQGAPSGLKATHSELRLRQLVCLPMTLDGVSLGVLYADGKAEPERDAPTRLALALAEHAALALDNARAYERATGDLLTGLPNNSAFTGHLDKALRSAPVAGNSGVLLIDLDDFKRVNLAAGAEMGDRALCEVAQCLREILRSDGLVARFGSDKFAVLLMPQADVKMALRLRDAAERARAAIAARVFCGIRLSACIGGVEAGSDARRRTAKEVIAFCDNILARARARGMGQVEIA